MTCWSLAAPIDPDAPLVGAWGEPSPQVPSEGAEGAKGGGHFSQTLLGAALRRDVPRMTKHIR